MYFTNEDINKEIRDNWEQLAESNDPKGLLWEWADSAVPIYNAGVIKDWAEMPSEYDDSWRELGYGSDSENSGIISLMRVDLYQYYSDAYITEYEEILEEMEAPLDQLEEVL